MNKCGIIECNEDGHPGRRAISDQGLHDLEDTLQKKKYTALQLRFIQPECDTRRKTANLFL